jgi:hypothetical protein
MGLLGWPPSHLTTPSIILRQRCENPPPIGDAFRVAQADHDEVFSRVHVLKWAHDGPTPSEVTNHSPTAARQWRNGPIELLRCGFMEAMLARPASGIVDTSRFCHLSF